LFERRQPQIAFSFRQRHQNFVVALRVAAEMSRGAVKLILLERVSKIGSASNQVLMSEAS